MRAPREQIDRARRALSDESTWVGVAALAARRYVTDGMPDRAPALAYYGILSLFPGLLIAVSVVRFFGVNAPDDVAHYVDDHGASDALAGAVKSVLATAISAPEASVGAIGLIGVGALIYGASRAFTATGRAMDAMGGRLPAARSPMRRLQDIGWTLVLLVMGIVTIILLAVSGSVLRDLLGLVGLRGAAVTIWSIVRWPAAIGLLLLAVAIVGWAAPTGRRPSFRLITHGTLVSVGVWLGASIGFGIYVRYLATYNSTYGAFAGSIILLLWIWLGSAALLYGAEVDAVLERRKDG
jgi:membrane protein